MTIRIPRTAAVTSTAKARLTMRNTTAKRSKVIPLEAISVDGDYFAVTGDFRALKSVGEYEYLLTLDGQNTARGLAFLGAIPSAAGEQYETEAEFTQYD